MEKQALKLICVAVFFMTVNILQSQEELDSTKWIAELEENKASEDEWDFSDTDSEPLIREFGMNVTGLVNQLVPFKQISNRTGPYSATLKFIRDRNAFRLGIGMHILTGDFFNGSSRDDVINFNMRLGFERRHIVNEKFIFYQTFDLMAMAGNFNSPINDFSDNEHAGAGLGLGLGIEYFIFKNLSLSTEGIGFLGVVGGTSSIFNATVIPPIAIFLNYKF